MLVKAMQRNPVDWDDEHILPWNGQERNGMMLELVTRQPVPCQANGRTQLDHRIFGRLEAANDIGMCYFARYINAHLQISLLVNQYKSRPSHSDLPSQHPESR